jgi:hypothetical protein
MAALDFYRQPTKSYFTVQSSFQPVLASFAYDRDIWRVGEPVKTELWLINDRWTAIDNARLSWRLLDRAGKRVDGGVTGGHSSVAGRFVTSGGTKFSLRPGAPGPLHRSAQRSGIQPGAIISENRLRVRGQVIMKEGGRNVEITTIDRTGFDVDDLRGSARPSSTSTWSMRDESSKPESEETGGVATGWQSGSTASGPIRSEAIPAGAGERMLEQLDRLEASSAALMQQYRLRGERAVLAADLDRSR